MFKHNVGTLDRMFRIVLGLALLAGFALNADADTPMGQRAMELYKQFVESEDGKGMDFSAMLPRFEKRGRDQA